MISDTFAEAVREALDEALCDPTVYILGQLARFGTAGMTSGLHERHPGKVLTYPVCEALMTASAMGMSLAGMRPVCVHERFDFTMLAMDTIVNHIPVWARRQRLPLVMLVVVGKGGGQGPQHSKDFTRWFESLEGWRVFVPQSPAESASMMKTAIFGDGPAMFVTHREHMKKTAAFEVDTPSKIVLCGASKRHEAERYA